MLDITTLKPGTQLKLRSTGPGKVVVPVTAYGKTQEWNVIATVLDVTLAPSVLPGLACYHVTTDQGVFRTSATSSVELA